MSIETESGATLPFERFWDWVLDHTNCILGVGTEDGWLYDAEACLLYTSDAADE